MPTELYGTLYGHDNLYVVMTMLKDIYAKKPQNVVAIATRAAQGAVASFTLICSPTRERPKAPSPLMDKYMAKLVSLVILSKNNTTHTSPVMLVARKRT